MSDTSSSTQQLTVAPPVHEYPPDAAGPLGVTLYIAFGVAFVMMGLLYRELRDLHRTAARLSARIAVSASSVASETRPGGEVSQ